MSFAVFAQLTEGRPPGQRPSLSHAASRQKRNDLFVNFIVIASTAPTEPLRRLCLYGAQNPFALEAVQKCHEPKHPGHLRPRHLAVHGFRPRAAKRDRHLYTLCEFQWCVQHQVIGEPFLGNFFDAMTDNLSVDKPHVFLLPLVHSPFFALTALQLKRLGLFFSMRCFVSHLPLRVIFSSASPISLLVSCFYVLKSSA